jgi:hypothetical protein
MKQSIALNTFNTFTFPHVFCKTDLKGQTESRAHCPYLREPWGWSSTGQILCSHSHPPMAVVFCFSIGGGGGGGGGHRLARL